MDLVGRKLPMRAGGVVGDLIARIQSDAAVLPDDLREPLEAAAGACRAATDWLLEHGLADPNDALAGAAPYLRLLATTVGGWLLARQHQSAAGSDDPFLRAKVVTARYFLTQVLPTATALVPAVTAGAAALTAISVDHLLGA
jgi:hypothetical protein